MGNMRNEGIIQTGGTFNSSATSVGSNSHAEASMKDQYNVSGGQIGAVGPNAHVHDLDFSQIWNQGGNSMDLPSLADELAKLRIKLREKATEREHDAAIVAVGDAEDAARKGDGPKTLEYLAKAGKWALDVATKIGVSVATEALKKASGL